MRQSFADLKGFLLYLLKYKHTVYYSIIHSLFKATSYYSPFVRSFIRDIQQPLFSPDIHNNRSMERTTEVFIYITNNIRYNHSTEKEWPDRSRVCLRSAFDDSIRGQVGSDQVVFGCLCFKGNLIFKFASSAGADELLAPMANDGRKTVDIL